MDSTENPLAARSTTEATKPGARRWQRLWPVGLGVFVAAATAYRLDDPRDAAPLVAASGLVYLAAGASGRRSVAWIAFAVTFALIGVGKFTGIDVLPWLLGLAAALLLYGLAERRLKPRWAFPLQATAMLVLGTTALLAFHLSPTAGGLLVAFALLAHAGWDIHHHRTDRVVDRSLATFCAVLDILVGVLVGVFALLP